MRPRFFMPEHQLTAEQAAQFCMQVVTKALHAVQDGHEDLAEQHIQGLAEWIRGDREMSEMLTLYEAARLMCEHCGAGLPVNRYDNPEDEELHHCWYHIVDDEGNVALCDARPIQDEIRRRGEALLAETERPVPAQVEMVAPGLAPTPERTCPNCGNFERFSNRYNLDEIESICDVCGYLFLKEVEDVPETGDRTDVPDHPDGDSDQPAVVDVPQEESDAEPVV